MFLRCIVCHNRNGGFCGQCAVAVGVALGDFYRPDKGIAARGISIEGTIFDFRRNILDFLVIHQQRYHARQGFFRLCLVLEVADIHLNLTDGVLQTVDCNLRCGCCAAATTTTAAACDGGRFYPCGGYRLFHA